MYVGILHVAKFSALAWKTFTKLQKFSKRINATICRILASIPKVRAGQFCFLPDL